MAGARHRPNAGERRVGAGLVAALTTARCWLLDPEATCRAREPPLQTERPHIVDARVPLVGAPASLDRDRHPAAAGPWQRAACGQPERPVRAVVARESVPGTGTHTPVVAGSATPPANPLGARSPADDGAAASIGGGLRPRGVDRRGQPGERGGRVRDAGRTKKMRTDEQGGARLPASGDRQADELARIRA
jgi:hypothetical protein